MEFILKRCFGSLTVCDPIVGLSFLILATLPSAGFAQFWAECRTGDESELIKNLSEHSTHMRNLHEKYITGYYRQDSSPSESPNLDQIAGSLWNLKPRRSALLFYAYNEHDGYLCTWLIAPKIIDSIISPDIVSHREKVDPADLRCLQPNTIEALGVDSLSVDNESCGDGVIPTVEDALQKAGRILLPSTVRNQIKDEQIDTLLLLPVLGVDSIPFSAIPWDEQRTLADIASLTILPGLFVFFEHPLETRNEFKQGLVMVSSSESDGKPDIIRKLRDQARQAADSLKAKYAADATITHILERLRDVPDAPLLYVVAHGRADSVDPNDGGMLKLDDGPLTGRTIVDEIDLKSGRPLVVLSACQSGLGKIFDVGTIGLARAWHQAGASNVVMSLWNVYQDSTSELMAEFFGQLVKCPPDKALQRAMINVRDKGSGKGVKHWSGFTILGMPTIPNASDEMVWEQCLVRPHSMSKKP